MAKLEKIGNELWVDLKPGDEFRMRSGPAITWFGGTTDVIVTSVKAASAGLKNRSLKMPLMENQITCKSALSFLAKVGTKVEIWSLEIDEQPVRFKGAFYLGHQGDIEFTARKVSFDDMLFLIEPKGKGTVYLALPKSLTHIPLQGRQISTPSDKIAILMGTPEFKKFTNKEEFKMVFSKGGLTKLDACEFSGADDVYIYGGKVDAAFGVSPGDDDD